MTDLEQRVATLEGWCESLDRQVAGFVELLHTLRKEFEALRNTTDSLGLSRRCQTCDDSGYVHSDGDKGCNPCPDPACPVRNPPAELEGWY